MSVSLHGRVSLEDNNNIDTTVQEKNITCSRDSKLAIKIISRLNKLVKAKGIQQRCTYVKEVKNCRLAIRHFRHPKKRAKVRKALSLASLSENSEDDFQPMISLNMMQEVLVFPKNATPMQDFHAGVLKQTLTAIICHFPKADSSA